ncbi:MAG: phosphoribosylamine--glycine ligase [Phycisphaerae bacterium]|nr:phosphoribosylamine--glycine ligase [Phycisphaerae bacterium]
MKILIIGGGGREHALAVSLAQSPRRPRIFCAPGNAGTAAIGQNVAIELDDFNGLVRFAQDEQIDLTVVGPEAPLCGGVVDCFRRAGLRIFGPTAAAARIEGDKAYAKRLMKAALVPTAEARIFQRLEEAKTYAASRDTGLVVKASGLAAGKGVIVCPDPADAILALEHVMAERAFGSAGDTVVVEELLKGEELSVFALVDGRTIYMLECAQDHKALLDGDTGPNTGGMGAYSPPPTATPDLLARVERDVLVPIVDALNNDDAPYQGILYAGLMITAAGPKVLEFNCRFGDPEAQVLLPRLCSDWLDAFEAVVDGRLSEIDMRWSSQCAVGVVLASAGYPVKSETGKVIEGLDDVENMPGVHVFHAATRTLEHLTLTAGGRVMCLTGIGRDVAEAQERAYAAAERIHFDGMQYRRDIAARASPTSGSP